MLNLVFKYLALNKKVSIPGVGNLLVDQSPAFFIEDASRISPPHQSIIFEQATAISDKNFYHFLSENMGISEVEAVRKYQDFSYQLRNEIRNNPFVEFPGVGVLRKDVHNDIVFESLYSPEVYFLPVDARPVLQPEPVEDEQSGKNEGEVEETIVQDRWWIWALLLAFAALAAMAYYYIQEEF